MVRNRRGTCSNSFSGASRFDIVVSDNIRLGAGAAIGVYWAYTRGWKSNRFSTQLVEDDEYFSVKEYLASEYTCVFERQVHPYSPRSSLMVFDISKSESTVQKTNQ